MKKTAAKCLNQIAIDNSVGGTYSFPCIGATRNSAAKPNTYIMAIQINSLRAVIRGNLTSVWELIANNELEALTRMADRVRKSESASKAPDQPPIRR